MSTPATPTPQPSQTASQISAVVGILAQANVAIPVIFQTITAVVGIVKALRGTAPPLAEIVLDIEKQVAQNRATGEAEIARLKAEIAAQ